MEVVSGGNEDHHRDLVTKRDEYAQAGQQAASLILTNFSIEVTAVFAAAAGENN